MKRQDLKNRRRLTHYHFINRDHVNSSSNNTFNTRFTFNRTIAQSFPPRREKEN